MLMLSQAIRRLNKPSVAMPGFAVGRLGSVLRQARVADFSPEQLGFLTYGRGVDTTRMREELGFEPRFTTASAFADFGVSLGVPLARRRARSRPVGGGPCLTPSVRRTDDADVIPIGTSGRPGRGTGRERPSAAARSLAGTRARRRAKKARPRRRGRRPTPARGTERRDAGVARAETAAEPASRRLGRRHHRGAPPARRRADRRLAAPPSSARPSRSSATSGSAAWPS